MTIIIYFSIIIMSSFSRFARFCGSEQDDSNLVPILPNRGIYIRVCISISLFFFIFSQQVTAVAPSTDMIPRHFFSRWLTSQDGHLWNCLRQGSIVITESPYTTAGLMDLRLEEEAMTFTSFPITRHLVAIPIATLALLTAHQAGTKSETPSSGDFWQEKVIILLLQMKWKHFTKRPKR